MKRPRPWVSVSLALIASWLAGTAQAANRTTPPAGCLVVSKTPSAGQYATIQAAINALSSSSAGSADQCVFIGPGTYAEQVVVPARRGGGGAVSIYGSTTDAGGYASNAVTITARRSQADGLSNDETGTLRVKAANFRMYNVNVDNAHGKGSQAIALSAYADSGYYGCAFTGFQDTLLANVGNQVYAKCLIQGATDFVFGQNAVAWFEACDVRVVTASVGYITANGRTSASNPSYYVFNRASVSAASGSTVPDGAYYLGRPWREYARVVFQNSVLGAVVNPAGWRTWNAGDDRTGGVLFAEFNNSGPGAATPARRAKFATALKSAVQLEDVLGGGVRARPYFDQAYF